MLQIDDTIISLDLLDEMFCCHLSSCKGRCCVEGESGAPVEAGEQELLEKALPVVWDDLSPEAQRVIDQQGVVYWDADGDCVTSIVNGKDCVFTSYTEAGHCICAIEKAYRAGKTDFCKPVSCHLYPIRVKKYRDFTAVNYHRWSVCRPAVAMGKAQGMRVYEFLKDALIRKFGEEWYQQLSTAFYSLYMQQPGSAR
jgi:hypothetical protein